MPTKTPNKTTPVKRRTKKPDLQEARVMNIVSEIHEVSEQGGDIVSLPFVFLCGTLAESGMLQSMLEVGLRALGIAHRLDMGGHTKTGSPKPKLVA